MDLISGISPIINGSISIFNVYVLFRIISIEKEVEREKKFFLEFRKQEKETNKELDLRLRAIEKQAARRWTTF